MQEKIQDGFLHDGEKSFGAVRQVRKTGILVYVENAGDFEVPLEAVIDTHSEKVILDAAKLPPALKDAIRRAHAGEDPRIG